MNEREYTQLPIVEELSQELALATTGGNRGAVTPDHFRLPRQRVPGLSLQDAKDNARFRLRWLLGQPEYDPDEDGIAIPVGGGFIV